MAKNILVAPDHKVTELRADAKSLVAAATVVTSIVESDLETIQEFAGEEA